MNIIQKVTWKSLRNNKRRTVVTILGVTICVSMLTAICVITTSLHDVLLRSTIKSHGIMEIGFSNMEEEIANKVIKDKRINQSMRISEVGYFDEKESPIQLFAMDFKHPQLQGITLIKGTFPTNEQELVISHSVSKQMGNVGVGDALTLPLYNQVYVEDEQNLEDILVREELGSYTYQITGIVEGDSISSSNGGMYVLSDYESCDFKNSKTNVSFNLLNRANFYEQYEDLVTEYKAEDNFSNSSYLMLQGVDKSGFLTTIIPVLLILVGIVLLGGVSLIYNAFSISLSERSRYLGMLSSIGATKQQKRNSVLYEACIIGIVAIPLGMFAGIVGIAITFFILNPYVAGAIGITNVSFEMVIHPLLLLITGLFCVLVLGLSAWIPAHRASKITAISAIQQNKDIKIRPRDVKTSTLTRNVFGFEAELGLKNMKRNRTRYISTLSSLIICIILFMCAQFSSVSMMSATSMMQNYTDADILINFYANDGTIVDMNQKELHELRTLKSVKHSLLYGEDNHFNLVDGVALTSELKAYLKQQQPEEIRSNYGVSDGQPVYPMVLLQILSDEDFEQYCKEIGSDVSLYDGKSASVVAVNQRDMVEFKEDEKTYRSMTLMDVQEGDTIPLTSNMVDVDVPLLDETPVLLHIASVTNQEPFFNKRQSNEAELLFVCNSKSYEYISNQMITKGYLPSSPFYEMQLIGNDINRLQEDVYGLEQQFPYPMSINDVAKQRLENTQRNIFFNTMLYGFVALILLVCIANIINSISTSINLRKREFAMIKSVGITKRKFNQMICFETLFYGIKAIVYGVPIGLLMIMIIYKVFMGGIFYFPLIVPIQTYIIMMIGIMVLLFTTVCYSLHKISGDNIVETIRKESI